MNNNKFEKDNGRPRVVIIGAGFGGLWAARHLADTAVDVYLLDRNNYHTFFPLLYQVAASELEPTQIGYPIRATLRHKKNVHFVLGEVTHVAVAEQLVHTHDRALSYDYLILATGSVSRFFGIPGADEHSFPLKSMEEGIRLRNHILRCFEQAEQTADPDLRRQLLTFVVVGGGATGVEYAGALSELIRGPLAKDYPSMNMAEVRVILLEAADTLLSMMPAHLSQYTVKRLQKMKVEVRLQTPVFGVTQTAVFLEDNATISTQTVVWTAGVGGEETAQAAGLGVLENGRLSVQPTLQLPNYPNIYAIGDLAAFKTESDDYLPMMAPVATQQGKMAAQNIKRQLKGEPLQNFVYRDRGQMATIGRNAAVAEIGGYAFRGFIAWLFWLIVHLFNLIGFRNRLMVLINWAWNYIFFERLARLILPLQHGRQGDTYGISEHAHASPQADRPGRP